MQRVIFLDRDGTLNRAITGSSEKMIRAPWWINEINFEPNLREAMMIFKDFGYTTVLATNQPDVYYGYLPRERWKKIFLAITKEARPDAVYYCWHTQAAKCECKKPKPGMLLQAAAIHRINLKKSWMIGDTEKDMLAGKRAGCRTILIRRPYNLENKEANDNADHVVKNLLEATAIV